MFSSYRRTLCASLTLFLTIFVHSTSGDDGLTSFRWGPWSLPPLACSVTCGRGVRCRIRQCLSSQGLAQSTADKCSETFPNSLGDKVCTSCWLYARCPRQPGWGQWSFWSHCLNPSDADQKIFDGCSIGKRVRERLCNNPPPEPPPATLPCLGAGHESVECKLFCDPSQFKDDEVGARIERQVERDFQQPPADLPPSVIRRDQGREVRLNCHTRAFRLARKLALTGKLSLIRERFAQRLVRIRWYKNGKPFVPIHPQQHFKSAKTFSSSGSLKSRRRRTEHHDSEVGELDNAFLDAEDEWMSEYPASPSAIERAALVIPSVSEGDQGFYTCELAYAARRWLIGMFSIIVVRRRLTAEASRPFYLHSNLGSFSALERGPVWFESAQLIWYLNGQKRLHGLAIRPDRRIHRIDYVNVTHQGVWQCYLVIPPLGHAHETVDPRARQLRRMLVNEFFLNVDPAPSTLWRLADQPASMRYLRNIAVSLMAVNLLLVFVLLLSFWAIYRWISRRLSADQIRAILQEIADDTCRLLLSGYRRSELSKARLLPFIMQQHKRLERARQTLVIRWRQFELGDNDEDNDRTGEEASENLDDVTSADPDRTHGGQTEDTQTSRSNVSSTDWSTEATNQVTRLSRSVRNTRDRYRNWP